MDRCELQICSLVVVGCLISSIRQMIPVIFISNYKTLLVVCKATAVCSKKSSLLPVEKKSKKIGRFKEKQRKTDTNRWHIKSMPGKKL